MIKTKKNKKELLKRLKDVLEKGTEHHIALERTPEIKDYHKYLALSREEKAQLKKDWDIYYERVRETRAYRNYQEMEIAFKKRDMGSIRWLREEAGKMLEKGGWEIPRPYLRDPVEFRMGGEYAYYNDTKRRIKKLEEEIKGETLDF